MAQPQTIDDYIAGFPEHVQGLLQQMRATIRAAAPDAKEAITYGMPTFVFHGNLVYFAGFNNHIGFYAAMRTSPSSSLATNRGRAQFNFR